MPLYKFYRIVPKDVSKTDCYIGHTTQPLRKRFSQHWDRRNRVGSGSCSSAMLFHNYGRDALEIVLIHELELPDKEFDRREERRLYEEYRERVVNKYRPIVTEEEAKERDAEKRRQWKDANKERHAEIKRQWYEANKERHTETQRQWREANKGRDTETKRQWYEANKERVIARVAERRAYDAGLKYFARITIE